MSKASSVKNNPMFDRTHYAKSKARISAVQGISIYVYSSDKSILINTFYSTNKTGKFFNCNCQTV